MLNEAGALVVCGYALDFPISHIASLADSSSNIYSLPSGTVLSNLQFLVQKNCNQDLNNFPAADSAVALEFQSTTHWSMMVIF